jgi:transcriptional regulator with XRE-family HTH domain
MPPLPPKQKAGSRTSDKVTLKTIAENVGVTAGTLSAALNNSSAARSIPEHTKNRIIAAAHELNYRPNFFARTFEAETDVYDSGDCRIDRRRVRCDGDQRHRRIPAKK